MSEKVQVSFIGSGIIYFKGRDIGNCSAADITYELDRQTLPNYRGGGGNAEVLERISAVSLAIGITSLNASNLALLNSAALTSLTTGPITDEELTVTALDRLIRVEHMIDKAATITVKDAADATVPRLDATTGAVNYIIHSAGIIVPAGSAIAAADDITITYSVPAGYILQALATLGEEGDIVIDGLNDVNGKPHVIDVWRWKPSPTGLSAITTEFANVTVTGEALADEGKPMGTSKFFRVLAAS